MNKSDNLCAQTPSYYSCYRMMIHPVSCAKGGDFKNGASHSDFMFVNIELYKSKKCVLDIKLLKYCDIDAHLDCMVDNHCCPYI